jgi:acyl-coenzyme A thioesterase PaaI-like protein
MLVSENVLKWALRFYPPLLLQRIWIIKFEKGFRGVKVKIVKSLLNKNYNDSIFGGTIFAAADPFYPVLFHQIFLHKGYKSVIAWSKSAEIQFLKPGHTSLYLDINITEDEISEAEQMLNTTGKYIRFHAMDIRDKNGAVCVSAKVEVYIRNLAFKE